MVNRKNVVIYVLMIVMIVTFLIFKYESIEVDKQSSSSNGRSLAYYDFYPVVVKSNGNIELDKKKVNEAIVSLSQSKVVDERASGELIRLIEKNSASFLINPENNEHAKLLKNKTYHPEDDNEDLLLTLKEVVHGVGQTLAKSPIEIVLHDTRNPLRSVIAIENPVTGRKLYDRNTNFGVELIKKYARNEIKNGNIISYPIVLDDGRLIKASTIPIYDDGKLIAFICINIDTSRVDSKNEYEVHKTIDSIVKISRQSEYADIKELIKPLNKENKYMALERLRYELEKPLLIIKERKGILACAYINPETCNKTGEACAIVSGVNDYEDMMESQVVAVSDSAEKLGIKIGDIGSEALEKLK